MAVYNDIIARSLRLLKVKESGENLSASEASDGLSVLNGLLDAWSNEPYMQWGLTEVSQALTTNDESYTIGSSGDINTTRPIRIDSAYIRDSNNVDTPLKLINAQEYSLITLKTFSSSYPCFLYYNQQYPLGVIKLFPKPSASLTLKMNVWSQISQAAAGTTTVDLPSGWQRALEYNLALELAPEYKPAGPDIIQKAMEAINRIKIANDDNTPVLRSPAQQAVNNNDYNYGDFY